MNEYKNTDFTDWWLPKSPVANISYMLMAKFKMESVDKLAETYICCKGEI